MGHIRPLFVIWRHVGYVYVIYPILADEFDILYTKISILVIHFYFVLISTIYIIIKMIVNYVNIYEIRVYDILALMILTTYVTLLRCWSLKLAKDFYRKARDKGVKP